MTCAPTSADADRCPTQAEITPQLIALLPQGRAWANDGGTVPTTSVLWKFWNAVAAVAEHANQRICALREEFWCATMSETRDRWLTDYGLPDTCDPFPDLCAKVAALGGARCEYFAAVALAAGWSIECRDFSTVCGSRAGGGGGYAGNAFPGRGPRGAVIEIDVDLAASPAFSGAIATKPLAGRMRAGMRLSCEPDVSGLRCILERIVPAHCTLILNLIEPPVYWMVSFGPTPDQDAYFLTGGNDPILTE